MAVRQAVRNVQRYRSGNVKVSTPVVSGKPGRSLWNGWNGGYQSGFKPRKPVAAASSPSVPAASSAAVAGPAAGVPSPEAGLPTDSLYTKQTGLNLANLNTGLAGITDRQTALGLRYGVNFTRNADGTLGDFQIDPNVDLTNPFSMAAELKRAYANRQRFNTNSMAASGQLYSGALQNAQDQAGFENQRGLNSLISGFTGDYGQTIADAARLRGEFEQGNIDALGAAIGRAPAPVAAPKKGAAAPPAAAPSRPAAARKGVGNALSRPAIRNSPYLSSWAKRNALKGR